MTDIIDCINITLIRKTCRHLYNDSLGERKRQAELNELERTFGVCPWGKPQWIEYKDQQNALPLTKTSYQKEVFSQVLQNVLKRVDRSFKNFFNGFGYPRFQGEIGTIVSHFRNQASKSNPENSFFQK
jgi:transposase